MIIQEKEFLPIDMQVQLLINRGMTVYDEENAARFLLQNNYYSVVNGYKDIFIDKARTGEIRKHSDDERYLTGTTFHDLEALFVFDKQLRHGLLDILIGIEKAFNTACVYSFCLHKGNKTEYLSEDAYCKKEQYYAPSFYARNKATLISTFSSIASSYSDKECVAHYLKKYGYLPLWVLSTYLTFGNIVHFYSFLESHVKDEVCETMRLSLGRDDISTKKIKKMCSVLPAVRNTCAHNERLFMGVTIHSHHYKISEIIKIIDWFRPENKKDESLIFVENMIKSLDKYDNKLCSKIIRIMDVR